MKNNKHPNKTVAYLMAVFLNTAVLFYLGKWKSALLFGLFALLFSYFLTWINAPYILLVSLILIISGLFFVIHHFFKNEQNLTKHTDWYSKWWISLLCGGVLLGSLLLIKHNIIQTFTIPSNSMSPTIEQGDTLFTNNLIRLKKNNLNNIQPGEIYVFESPYQQPFVFRVIGLPNDKITLDQNILSINGKAITHTLLTNKPNGYQTDFIEQLGRNSYTVRTTQGINNPQSNGTWTVLDNHLFFLGDNRDNAADSRYIGMIHQDKLIGKVIAIRKPLFEY